RTEDGRCGDCRLAVTSRPDHRHTLRFRRRHMGWSVRRWSTSMAFLLLTGCTPAAPYRTELPARPPDCPSDANGAVSPSCRETRHEGTDDYDLLVVEFYDKGLLCPHGPVRNVP